MLRYLRILKLEFYHYLVQAKLSCINTKVGALLLSLTTIVSPSLIVAVFTCIILDYDVIYWIPFFFKFVVHSNMFLFYFIFLLELTKLTMWNLILITKVCLMLTYVFFGMYELLKP